jgi:hypothetical protein
LASVLLALTLPGGGCDDDDEPGSLLAPTLTGAFASSSTSAAADLVRLRGGGASGDTVTVEVAISGPTTSGDLYSFAFDLLLSDASVAGFVGGSAVFGTALVPSGDQGSIVDAVQVGNRVVVGVSKSNGGSGNGIGSSEQVIVSLDFRVLREGTTQLSIVGSPTAQGNPTDDPAALDSTGAVIDSVAFDGASARLIGTR